MEFYKKGQAEAYRLIFGVIILLLGVFGAWKWFNYFRSDELFGIPVDWVGVALFALLGLGLAYFFAARHAKTVDYIIATDDEMRKVTWPSKEELKDSSVLVIVVMVILGAITTAFDAVFIQLLKLFSTF